MGKLKYAFIASTLSLGMAFSLAMGVAFKKGATQVAAVDEGVPLDNLVLVTPDNISHYVGQEVYMIYDDNGVASGVALDKETHTSKNVEDLTKIVIMRNNSNVISLACGNNTAHYLSIDYNLIHFESSTRTDVLLNANGALTTGPAMLAYTDSVKFVDNYAGSSYIKLYGHQLATENEHLYLVGSFASHSNYNDLAAWTPSQDGHPVIVNSAYPTVFYFVNWNASFGGGDEFKLCALNNWNPQVGIKDFINGTAYSKSSLYEGDGNNFGPFSSNSENLYTQYAGKYEVYVTHDNDGYHLIIDHAKGEDAAVFYYTGTDTTKAADGQSWSWQGGSLNPVYLDRDPVTFTFNANEEFKFKRPDWWGGALTVTPDADENKYYYGAFQRIDGGNAKVLHTGEYKLSLKTVDHSIQMQIEFANPEWVDTYVLDLFNSPLSVTQNAHLFDGDALATNWPGDGMEHVSGHIYKVTHLSELTKVIFNEGTQQTATIDIVPGKVFVLGGDWNGVGSDTAHSWISLEAATFIDDYMHFADVSTSETGRTENCEDYYGAAKTHYNALSSNDVRLEVLSLEVVELRLSAWAAANEDTLDPVEGNVLSANPALLSNNINSISFIVIVMSIVAVSSIAVATVVVIRKKHKNI